MGYLPSLFGNVMHGNYILNGRNFYISDEDVNPPQGIEIQFYSPSGEFVGLIGNTYDNGVLVNFELKDERYGGLKSFEFSISKKVGIPFYNLMECRFHIDGVWWFTGELDFVPDQEKNLDLFQYEGHGFSKYLEKIKINEVYENKTISFILNDIISSYIDQDTPILYNASLINPPDLVVTKIEFNDKSVKKAVESLLEIANYNYTKNQYRYGVNKDKHFFFEAVSNDVQRAFFEGYQFQDPDVKSTESDIVNKINIYRAKENSDETEYVDTVEDTESQGLYGLRERNIVISDYVDIIDAGRIASYLLEYRKAPIKSIKVKNLRIEENPYEIGFYKINSRINDYYKIINECSTLADWNTGIVETSLTVSEEKVLSGKRAFKIVTANGSSGEYFEYTLNEGIFFPRELIFYIAQNPLGDPMVIQVFDEDGNTEDFVVAFRLTEDNDFRITEDGALRQLESGASPYNIILVDDYQKITFTISTLTNIKRVRFTLITNEVFTIYLDRIEVYTKSYFTNNIVLENIKYTLNRNNLLADCVFDEEVDNIINDIKELNDKQKNILNIFEKS